MWIPKKLYSKLICRLYFSCCLFTEKTYNSIPSSLWSTMYKYTKPNSQVCFTKKDVEWIKIIVTAPSASKRMDEEWNDNTTLNKEKYDVISLEYMLCYIFHYFILLFILLCNIQSMLKRLALHGNDVLDC